MLYRALRHTLRRYIILLIGVPIASSLTSLYLRGTAFSLASLLPSFVIGLAAVCLVCLPVEYHRLAQRKHPQ